jgi:hypothetical protein
MILPSDDDSRKDDDAAPANEGDDKLPWEGDPDPPGFFGEESADDPAAGTVHNPAPPGWREDLREDLADALAELKEIEDPAEDFDPPEPPDLYTFYSELVTMRNDLRTIGSCLTQLVPPEAAAGPADAQKVVAALVKAWDDMEETAKAHQPILTPVMKAAGLTRIKVKAGGSYDPAAMTTDDKLRSGSKVAREIFSGWVWNGIVVRPAHVALK